MARRSAPILMVEYPGAAHHDRFRLSERISQMCANADGTVGVWTEVKGQELFTKRSKYWTARKFILKKMKKEWRIITTTYYDHCEG